MCVCEGDFFGLEISFWQHQFTGSGSDDGGLRRTEIPETEPTYALVAAVKAGGTALKMV